jgi:excisionase family DNA binding protein
MSDTLKRYLSVKQVCERLSVCKSLIYRLVSEGIIPCARLGGRILIPEDALAAILQSPVREESLPQQRQAKRPRNRLDLW